MKKPFIILAILLLITGCSVVKKSGRSEDKPAAYLFETDSYSLTLPSDYGLESGEETEYSIFQFSISASDLESPDEQKQKFDGIMGTIVFK